MNRTWHATHIIGAILLLTMLVISLAACGGSPTPTPTTTTTTTKPATTTSTVPSPTPSTTVTSPSPTAAPSSYDLKIDVSPVGGGIVNPSSGKYNAGSQLNLQAAAADFCWVFDRWGGDISGNTTTTSVTMNGNKNITAYFNRVKYNLTVKVSPENSGTTGPEGGIYDCGQSVTVTASPSAGYVFDRWGGDASGTDNATTVVMQSNKSLSAFFKPTYQVIKRDMMPGSAVQNTISFSAQLKAGDKVTGYVELSGEVHPGESDYVWEFVIAGPRSRFLENWNGNVVSTTRHEIDKVVPEDGTYVMKISSNTRWPKTVTIQITPGGWAG